MGRRWRSGLLKRSVAFRLTYNSPSLRDLWPHTPVATRRGFAKVVPKAYRGCPEQAHLYARSALCRMRPLEAANAPEPRCDTRSGCRSDEIGESGFGQNVVGERLYALFELVLAQFPLQGADRDAKTICRVRTVAPARIQRLGNRQLLELFHRETGGKLLGRRGGSGAFEDAIGQIALGQHFALSQDHHAFERVPQLADVARPAIADEPPHDFRRDLSRRGVLVGCNLLEEMLDQDRDVVDAIAQRREDNLHDVEPIEQVLAERAIRD